MCYNGYSHGPEDEEESVAPYDRDTGDDWKGGTPPIEEDGDQWKTDGWRYGEMTPEERMFRDMLDDEASDGA